jgi:diguanylate cyclase (GGDEF)-like protein
VALADFRGGAVDFIEKHDAFRSNNLRRRVFEVIANHKRRMMATLMERRRQESGVDQNDEELIAAARMDPLMRIFNRAAFTDLHASMHAAAIGERWSYALCLLDVDRFKQYNDNYGHAAGDEALVLVAAAIQSMIRPEDFVARFGGEEIVVLLTQVNESTVVPCVRRLCDGVAKLEIPHEFNEHHGCVTVSAGAAVFQPGSGEAEIDLIERADAAMYESKAAGRNTVTIAAPAGYQKRRSA